MKAANRSHRSQILLGVLFAFCLVGINVWAVSKMLASQRALDEASRTLNKSQQLVAEIERLRNRPRIASLEQETTTGMTDRVELAMQEAGIPSSSKLSSTPLEAIQKGTTQYKERLTEIKLDPVSMQQVVRFCLELEDPLEGLTVRDLEMRASKFTGDSQIDLWDVTVTLSQLIYSVSL